MNETGNQLAQTLKSSLPLLTLMFLPNHPIVSALPNSPVTEQSGESILNDYTSAPQYSNLQSDETSHKDDKEHCNWTVLGNMTPERLTVTSEHSQTAVECVRAYLGSEVETVARGVNQLENVGRTSVGKVVQETGQIDVYHEDVTELRINVRWYEDERSNPVPFDSIRAEGLGVTENPSVDDSCVDKCSSEEFLTLQVRNIILKAYRFNMFNVTSAKILKILINKT